MEKAVAARAFAKEKAAAWLLQRVYLTQGPVAAAAAAAAAAATTADVAAAAIAVAATVLHRTKLLK